MNENGEGALLREEDEALDRWAAIWNRKAFPEEPIRAYRERWRERFDLLDAERPFYQVPEAKIGTPLSAAKLNGEILQSEHKLRIFANRTEVTSGSLSFAEAARRLVYLQGFDDSGLKKKTPEGKENAKEKRGTALDWMDNLGVCSKMSTIGDTMRWPSGIVMPTIEPSYFNARKSPGAFRPM